MAEDLPLLHDGRLTPSEPSNVEISAGLSTSQLMRLYFSHFLSTWNSRCYEFAAILFTATAYPGTLTVSSVRGLLANLSAMLLTSSIGRWADKHPSRLHTLRLTICVQRVTICLACFGWSFVLSTSLEDNHRLSSNVKLDDRYSGTRTAVMCGLVVLGMVERLSAVANNIVMERDWVPTLTTHTSKPPLHVLNASMKRIDLISKLVAPIFISFASMASNQTVMAFAVGAMNLILFLPEWVCAKYVWTVCTKLQEPKLRTPFAAAEDSDTSYFDSPWTARWTHWTSGLQLYFSHDVWRPSLAIALQSYSVLSLSASLTTYLLNIHYTLGPITAARSLSSVIEFSSTIIMPFAVSRLTHLHRNPLVALAQVGTMGLLWQCVTLLPATISLLLIPTTSPEPESSHPVATGLFFVLLALSRLGLWTSNLVELTIVQISISPASRAEFSGVEMAFMSAAEIGRWGITGVLPRPSQFKGVAISGLAVVYVSFLLFLSWAQSRHLRGIRSSE